MPRLDSLVALAALALVACGSKAAPPASTAAPAAPAPPRIERWKVAGGFDEDGTTSLAAYGDRLWVTHHHQVGVYSDGLTTPVVRFTSMDSPVYKRPVEFWLGVCESNGHVFAVGHSLASSPSFGLILHGAASGGPLAAIKTPTKLPFLGSVWCNDKAAYAVGGGTLLRASTETDASALEWTRVTVDAGAGGLSRIHGVGEDIWAVGPQGLVLHGSNDTWTKVPSGASVDLKALWTMPDGNVWIGGEKETLLHTTDAGKSWTKVPIDTYTKQPLLAVYADPSIVLVGDACGAVYASEDGGAHFQREGDLTRCGEGVHSFARHPDGTLIAATAKYVFKRGPNAPK